ncbi:terminase small subunit [Bacillus massiliigorillae]|uniref:terminase small subunit n=1 Tax=Bacillus massiliigorillae TaxID=1243664 RepID=UPI00039D7188|nr:terminase small subunit [Bacillus massiliigorillae]
MNKLTEKQKRFADYYIELGNATEAYLKAGYKEKGARANAARLIAKDSIRAYIDERLKDIESERIAKGEEVLKFLTSVMRGELTEQIPVGLGEGAQRLEDKDTYLKDRVKAAELLGKRYSMWTEKQQVELTVPTFVDDVPDED